MIAWVCLVWLLSCKGEGSSPVSLKLLKGEIFVFLYVGSYVLI